ncbi:hypothetical protein HDU98_009222 [Podochytrium sp. JEL0797]|nr:hypothetical protein HDU98_009222 [Podochytrium sp. JEL0797]
MPSKPTHHTFDVGAAIYTGFTALMTQVVQNARKSVRQKGGDPAETGKILIWIGWASISIGVMAGFQGTLVSLGQIAVMAGWCLKQGFLQSWAFVYQPKRLRGTTFALSGFVLVLLHYTFLGCLIEIAGLICIMGYDHLLVV